MTTEEISKMLCKWMVDNANRPLSEVEKEIIKKAIDEAKTPQEMVAAVSLLVQS